MAKDPAALGSFEIPGEVRNFAERSVDQARKAFDGFISATQKAATAAEGQAAVAQSGAKEMRQKAMAFAEANVSKSFDFAQQLVRARDVEEVMRLQTDFVRAQMQALSEQAQVLGQTATKTAADTTKSRS
jgi:phasin